MLQMLGACMVFAGCLGTGYGIIRRNNKIILIMETWEYILQMFVSEITYKKETLGYACYEIGEKIGGKEGKLLEKICKKTEGDQRGNFYQIWEEECIKYCQEEKLPVKAIELIKEFGKMTGFEDDDVQKKMIEIQKEKWTNERLSMKEELLERKKVILTLSSCLGMMIILLLW